jgi:hypothetical protein
MSINQDFKTEHKKKTNKQTTTPPKTESPWPRAK